MSRKRWFFSLLATFILVSLGSLILQGPVSRKSDAQAPPPAAAPATPAGGADSKDAELPEYFSLKSKDPSKSPWPDPTGGSAGVWATPASDKKGDPPPSSLTPA